MAKAQDGIFRFLEKRLLVVDVVGEDRRQRILCLGEYGVSSLERGKV